MTTTTRLTALAAPLLMLIYGINRYVDGLDGDRGNGIAWDIGHTAFFFAFVLFAVLAVSLHRIVPVPERWQRHLRDGALVAALIGAASFLWVTLTDLVPAIPTGLPEWAMAALPALFQVGMLTLLGQLVAARRVPIWTPLVMLFGFMLIVVNLDLLPFASVVILAGLSPLARKEPVSSGSPRPVGP
ncbi:hypothetical protein Ais01nite_44440 [Asanoa ishikariensis]|uniref:Low temperature requirement A protein (LtrA) n=1 Tax=Asanoa ishikariensis TaxID=137265 RepID=A0A1H3S7Y8_9ACTN|nr:hypothetical protein [Asanoa ishikariensis]GIF66409.1 hypothetical protein Ais01nite_44440 [Asanoa ishikariensis]SDZ33705.1 hypothetical protein SAMN05421684_4639 [Asanoa ishikariensis]